MREDIKRLLEMIYTIQMGDEIKYSEYYAIVKKYNFDLDEGIVDLEEEDGDNE